MVVAVPIGVVQLLELSPQRLADSPAPSRIHRDAVLPPVIVSRSAGVTCNPRLVVPVPLCWAGRRAPPDRNATTAKARCTLFLHSIRATRWRQATLPAFCLPLDRIV